MKPRHKKTSRRGRKYKSRLEALIAKRLGKNATYETETIYYMLPKRYKPDFVVPLVDGAKRFIEVKGYFRYEDQQKMRAVKSCNPSLDIRLFFPSDGKVQGSSMKCSEWCEKHGYPYAIGRLPNEWLHT